jgi:hypothetical protein
VAVPRRTEEAPVVVPVMPTPLPKHEADRRVAERDQDVANNRWIMWSTVFTAAFTFVLADHIKIDSRVIQRAYINAHQVASLEDYRVGVAPRLRLTIINSGQTPGWTLEAAAATISVRDVAAHLPHPMPSNDIGMHAERIVVFAKQHTEWINGLNPVSQDEYDNVSSGVWKLVIFGRIKHRDTFRDIHHTDFCFVWDFHEGTAKPNQFGIHPDVYTDAT